MAGMYPDDQYINIFGKPVRWPCLKEGKFSNGSFADPLVPPSFIPAETINLILDNLTRLISALGEIPNNTGIDQLKTAITKTLAPLDSPELTGIPTVPTADPGTESTQIANTAFVVAAITALINASPEALDTLQELAAALGHDPNFATTITNALAAKAPLVSPALTGTPTAPTAGAGTNTTQLATTAFVKAAIAALVNSSPATLDTLVELATAIGNDPNFATTMTNALAAKAPLASPALSGTPTAPTATVGTNTTQIATMAALLANVVNVLTDTSTTKALSAAQGKALQDTKAPLASPALTGTPTAPTAAVGTNTTQIATTAFAQKKVGEYYTQYSLTGLSDLATMFPASGTPATLFGGTWSEQFVGEEVFFKTAPGTIESDRGKTYNAATQAWDGAGTVGIQGDAIQDIAGEFGGAYYSGYTPETGPFKRRDSMGAGGTSGSLYIGIVRDYFKASLVVPVASTNRPKNRLIKVWKKTA